VLKGTLARIHPYAAVVFPTCDELLLRITMIKVRVWRCVACFHSRCNWASSTKRERY